VSGYAENFERYREVLDRTVRYDLGMFELPKDARILDLGCAFGDDIRRLVVSGHTSVIGIEPDPYCVERCIGLDVRQGTIERTGLAAATMDVVLVDNVFHHIPDYAEALDEIRRVLRPEGLLCFIEPRRSILRIAMDLLTFRTPLPRIVGGPVRLRWELMSEEVRSGLYPQWLRSHREFFRLLDERFEVLWLRRHPFFYFCKARVRKPA
jgi:SAM-dependent methyltransferase